MEIGGSLQIRDVSCAPGLCTGGRISESASHDRLSQQFAVLLTIGRHMLEPAGQRSMLRSLLDDLVQGLAAQSGAIRISLPDGDPWQVETLAAGAPSARYLESYRKAEVIQSVWATGRPAVVPQWCRSREECQQQRAVGDGHAVCTTSFVCVPIALGGERLGVVSLDFPRGPETALWECAQTISVVAGWIAHDCLVRGLLSAGCATPHAASARGPAPVTGVATVPPDVPASVSPSLLRPPEKTSLRAQIRDIEREAIEKSLSASGGNMSAAARQLGITPRMMRYKLKILKIQNTRSPRKRHPETRPPTSP